MTTQLLRIALLVLRQIVKHRVEVIDDPKRKGELERKIATHDSLTESNRRSWSSSLFSLAVGLRRP